MSSLQDIADRMDVEALPGEFGWRFTERVYEVRYLDTAPLSGSAPSAADEVLLRKIVTGTAATS